MPIDLPPIEWSSAAMLQPPAIEWVAPRRSLQQWEPGSRFEGMAMAQSQNSANPGPAEKSEVAKLPAQAQPSHDKGSENQSPFEIPRQLWGFDNGQGTEIKQELGRVRSVLKDVLPADKTVVILDLDAFQSELKEGGRTVVGAEVDTVEKSLKSETSQTLDPDLKAGIVSSVDTQSIAALAPAGPGALGVKVSDNACVLFPLTPGTDMDKFFDAFASRQAKLGAEEVNFKHFMREFVEMHEATHCMNFLKEWQRVKPGPLLEESERLDIVAGKGTPAEIEKMTRTVAAATNEEGAADVNALLTLMRGGVSPDYAEKVADARITGLVGRTDLVHYTTAPIDVAVALMRDTVSASAIKGMNANQILDLSREITKRYGAEPSHSIDGTNGMSDYVNGKWDSNAHDLRLAAAGRRLSGAPAEAGGSFASNVPLSELRGLIDDARGGYQTSSGDSGSHAGSARLMEYGGLLGKSGQAVMAADRGAAMDAVGAATALKVLNNAGALEGRGAVAPALRASKAGDRVAGVEGLSPISATLLKIVSADVATNAQALDRSLPPVTRARANAMLGE